MTDSATIEFTGASGKNYTFQIYDFQTNFNAVPAVYVVTRRQKENGVYSHTVLYVGQTDNLFERFENHHKANCFRNNYANAICVRVEYNEQVRLNIESDLIRKYRPPCNG